MVCHGEGKVDARHTKLRFEITEVPPFPHPLELDTTEGLAEKVCLWTKAPRKNWKNKKITGDVWRSEGKHTCFLLEGHGDEVPLF